MIKEFKACGLTRKYGKRDILKGINLNVMRGEVVGLLGPNGAGKTTTFHIMAGMLCTSTKTIFLDNLDISFYSMLERARRGIVYLPQESSVFSNLSVRENLMAVLEFQKLTRSERLKRQGKNLSELKIEHLAEQKAYSLSGGERRRLEIARALCLNPSFMLMDEPFTGIDPITITDLQGIILTLKKKNIGILITDHNVRDTLSICDRAYILYDGSILEKGTRQEILESKKARLLYLGSHFNI